MLLPIYAIRVSAIQKLRCIVGSSLTLEAFIGRLTTFELSNFDNFTPRSVDTTFSAKLTLDDSKDKKKKKKKVKYVDSDSESNDEDIEELEALISRGFHRGKGK